MTHGTMAEGLSWSERTAAAGLAVAAGRRSGWRAMLPFAGPAIMQDFVHFRIPLWVRRVVTMVPTFIVVGVGATQALVVSQVVLSLVLPVPMIALVWITARRDVMGEFVNSEKMTIIASVAAAASAAIWAIE